jgi:Carbohydrate binding domain
MRTLIVCLLAILVSNAEAEKPDFPPLFEFVVSYDNPENVTNISPWLSAPAGRDGLIRCEGGNFANDAGPIRFWATNLCFEACFPTREKAKELAERLARLGINCVRMHHIDMHSIWGDSGNHLKIDPEKLDRLDWLVYCLKQKGIYTNLNLHVSRWFDESDGFDSHDGRPLFDKGLDNFHPRMIELQKKYARDLLTHINPYTGKAYTNEPAIAMVEVNNENGLCFAWSRDQLDELAEPYSTLFRQKWNQWLVDKYWTTEQLRTAWAVGQILSGDELLKNGDFSKPVQEHWDLDTGGGAIARLSILENGGPDGGRYLRLDVDQSGAEAWQPQFSQSNLNLKKGHIYTLSFSIRTKTQGRLSVNVMANHSPYNDLGLDERIGVSSKWRRHNLTFEATGTGTDARVTFTGLEPNRYELANISLRSGGQNGLEDSQTLEDSSVDWLRHQGARPTAALRADWIDFLLKTERDYWRDMDRFLKDDLKVQMPISGTQLGFGLPSMQSEFDYLDAHSYWDQPVFTAEDWDMKNWFVRNRALVNYPDGTFCRLAMRRIDGKPYTVSEYNHPEPNQYSAEGFPMIAAFGAFQAWDGIFSFTYQQNLNRPRRIGSYFDIDANSVKLVHMPACAAMFVRGDVATGQNPVVVSMTTEQERDRLIQHLSPWTVNASAVGATFEASLLHRIAMKFANEPKPVPTEAIVPKDRKVFRCDTGQIYWDTSDPNGGYFTVDSPRTKLFTGFIRGRTFEIGEIKLSVGATRLDWTTISMTVVEGTDFKSKGRILLAATGVMQNRGAQLQYDNGRVTLGDQWGDGPVICEGIPAKIGLPVDAGRVRFYPLDEVGSRRLPAKVEKDERGQAVLQLAPEHKTLWYEAVIE